MKLNLLFTICARAGSKGVKNKNVRDFLEIPLVNYTIAAYQLFIEKYGSNYSTIDIAVNTDSSKLVDLINKTNLEYIYIKRTSELGGDTVSKPDVIKDTLKKAEAQKEQQYDIVVDLDLTSPIRTVEDIDKIVQSLVSNTNADVAFSMTNSRRSPYFNQVCIKETGFYNTVIQSQFVTRQEAPVCFDMNASIYGYRRRFILDDATKRVFDGRAVGVTVRDTAVLDIDNEEDLELMEVLANYFYEKYLEYVDIKKRAKQISNPRT